MTKNTLTGLVAGCFDASADTPIPVDIHLLVREALERTMHLDATRQAVSGDSEGLAALGRSITVDEGRLLESIVVALARRNGDFAVLSSMKLPVSDAALALIERNADQGTISSLSLDPEGRSRRHYHPDLVLANHRTAEAIVIDVKRSLGGYLGSSKLSELKTRMQAAGLVLPDILWRDHQRLAVKRVSVAIIDGSRTDQDVTEGIWSLARLDELCGVPGAGVIAQSAIAAYRRGIPSFGRVPSETQSARLLLDRAFQPLLKQFRSRILPNQRSNGHADDRARRRPRYGRSRSGSIGRAQAQSTKPPNDVIDH